MIRRHRKILLTSVSVLLALDVSFAIGQAIVFECDPSVSPIGGMLGYAPRKGDARCEGIYQSPANATGPEVVSVTLGRLEFDTNNDDRLAVSLPDLTGMEVGAVWIKAVALPDRTFYRMDSLLVPGETMAWPIGAVIRPWGLADTQLGVLGWLEQDGERVTIPVLVAPEGQQSKKAGDTVEIKLRSSVDLERIVWRSALKDGPVSRWLPVVKGSVRGGEIITFRPPSGPVGVVRLDFSAKRKNTDDWLTLTLNLWRPKL